MSTNSNKNLFSSPKYSLSYIVQIEYYIECTKCNWVDHTGANDNYFASMDFYSRGWREKKGLAICQECLKPN